MSGGVQESVRAHDAIGDLSVSCCVLCRRRAVTRQKAAKPRAGCVSGNSLARNKVLFCNEDGPDAARDGKFGKQALACLDAPAAIAHGHHVLKPCRANLAQQALQRAALAQRKERAVSAASARQQTVASSANNRAASD